MKNVPTPIDKPAIEAGIRRWHMQSPKHVMRDGRCGPDHPRHGCCV